MARKETKKPETAPKLDHLPLASAMMAMNPAATKAWVAIMSESARFVSDRLRQDFEAQKALLACQSPADLIEVQTEFMKKAIQQYTAEMTRLYDIVSDATEDSIETARTDASRKADDVPV